MDAHSTPMKTLSITLDFLTSKQKAKLHLVADLMLEIFRTLARMRYLDPDWIQPGPHDISALMPLYESLSLDPAVIYLYSILPYLDPKVRGKVDFFGGGDFADFRVEGDVVQGRDPMYAENMAEEGMRPWMTPLSNMRNHGDVLIYDARRHVVGIFDQMDFGSRDRNLKEGRVYKSQREDGEVFYYRVGELGTQTECDVSVWEAQATGHTWRDDDFSEDEEEEDGDEEEDADEEDGGDDEEEEEEEKEEEENIWDEMEARPAGKVLRDIIRWYHELVEVPGGGENSPCGWLKEFVAPLYRKHGWPGENFDGDAFLADKARADAAELGSTGY